MRTVKVYYKFTSTNDQVFSPLMSAVGENLQKSHIKDALREHVKSPPMQV